MAIYTMLQTGSRGEEVKRMQQALEQAGYSVGSPGVDGIYGKYTAAAVRRYQTDQKLQVDGIAGDETLTRLYGTAASEAPAARPTLDPEPEEIPSGGFDAASDLNFTRAQAALEAVRQQRPVWEDRDEQLLEEAYSRIVGRAPFRYDAQADPLYRQYAGTMARQGRLAMQDTVGQAAALTGGYGSSYAQVAGQQQYGEYLQQLQQALPEFYGLALEQYTAEGAALEEQYALLQKQQAASYARYQDALSQYWKEVDSYEQQLRDAYDQSYTAWKTGQDSQKTAYSRLQKLITDTGYTPTNAQLQAAGMSRTEANAFARHYKG